MTLIRDGGFLGLSAPAAAPACASQQKVVITKHQHTVHQRCFITDSRNAPACPSTAFPPAASAPFSCCRASGGPLALPGGFAPDSGFGASFTATVSGFGASGFGDSAAVGVGGARLPFVRSSALSARARLSFTSADVSSGRGVSGGMPAWLGGARGSSARAPVDTPHCWPAAAGVFAVDCGC